MDSSPSRVVQNLLHIHADTAVRREIRHPSQWRWSLAARTGLSPAAGVQPSSLHLKNRRARSRVGDSHSTIPFAVPTVSDRGGWGTQSQPQTAQHSTPIPPAGNRHLAAESPLRGTMPAEHAPSWRAASPPSQLAPLWYSPLTVGDSSSSSSDSDSSSGGGGGARVPGARVRIIAPGRRDGARLRLELF